MTTQVEKVSLQVEAPAIKGSGLKDAHTTLQAIDFQLASINRQLSGLSVSSTLKKSAAQIKTELEHVLKGKPVSTNPEALAKALGLDPKAVRSFVTQARAELGNLLKGSEFRNLTAASKGLAQFTTHQSKLESQARAAIAGTLGGRPAGVPVSHVAATAQAVLSGPVKLEIPGHMVHAVLTGPITVTGAAGTAAVAAPPGGGGGGAVGSNGGAANFQPNIGAAVPGLSANELKRRVTKTSRQVTTEITQAIGELETLTETFKGSDHVKTTTTRRSSAVKQLRDRLGLITTALGGDTADAFTGVRSTDLRTGAGLKRKAAGEIAALAKDPALQSLMQNGVSQQFTAKAKALRSQAAKDEVRARKAEAREVAAAERAAAAEQKRQRNEAIQASRAAEQTTKGAKQAVAAAGKARLDYENFWKAEMTAQAGAARIGELEAAGFVRTASRRGSVTDRTGKRSTESHVLTQEHGGVRTAITATATLGANGEVLSYRFGQVARALRATRAEASAAGRDFLKNTAHVTIWAASVGVLYGTLGLLKSSMQGLVQTGLQTRRLEQVFSGVGGSAMALRDDVLALAAANGRSTEEALDSAIRWSRLGLSRAQMNEAVRVSLIAANVAEMTAAQSTEKLSAVMTSYGLEVTELAGLLGMLNQISNTYNVTNQDLLIGLSRVASVAKQAGIPLAELAGLIGATVGITGQSGANIGNAIKSLVSSLGAPRIQGFLQDEFQLQVRTEGSEGVKNMNEVLADLFVKFQELTRAESQYLLVQVARKTQASRVAALLDNYVKAQTLAITAQLNLNSAEKENAKIKATLAAQLKGIATEWDRLVSKQADRGLTNGLLNVSEAFRNVLNLMNTPLGGGVLTGFLALLTVLGARMAVTGLRMRQMNAQAGFVGQSIAKAQWSLRLMSVTLKKVNHDFAMATAGAGRFGGALVGIKGAGAAGSRMVTALSGSFRFLGTALKGVGVGLLTLGPELLVIGGAVYLFNQGMELLGRSSEAADRQLAGFNEEAERAASAAKAAGTAIRLLNTVKAALPNLKNPERNIGHLREAGLVTSEDEKQLLIALKKKDVAEAMRILELRRADQAQAAALERMKELDALLAEEEKLKEIVAKLNRSPFASEDKKREFNNRLEEVQGKKVRHFLDAEEGTDESNDDVLAADAKHQAQLSRNKKLAEGIAEIYRSLPTSAPSARMSAELDSLQAQLDFLEGRKTAVHASMKDTAAEAAQREEKVAALLERKAAAERTMAQARRQIADSGREGGRFGRGNDAARRAGAAQDELKEIEKDLAHTRAMTGPNHTRNMGELQDLDKATRELEKRKACQKAQFDAFAEFEDRKALALSQAKSRGDSFGYGTTAGERLKNKQAGLERLIGEKVGVLESGSTSETDRQVAVLGLVQHRADLYDLLLEKQQRRMELEKDEKQLIQENVKEFQRGLITAGPGELLRKLTAFQLGAKGVSSGRFFSLSPDMRRDMEGGHPEFSQRGRDLKQERAALGPAQSIAAMQRVLAPLAGLPAQLRALLPQGAALQGAALQGVLAQTAAAAQQMNGLAKNAGLAAAALGQLPALVAQVQAAVEGLNAGGAPTGPYLPNGSGYAPGV